MWDSTYPIKACPLLYTSGAVLILSRYVLSCVHLQKEDSLVTKSIRKGKQRRFVLCTHSCHDRFLYSQTQIILYRGADKSLARPGRKQANVSVRMAWISFGALPCREKKTWWQFVHIPDMLPSLFPSWSGLRTYQHPVLVFPKILMLANLIYFFNFQFSMLLM